MQVLKYIEISLKMLNVMYSCPFIGPRPPSSIDINTPDKQEMWWSLYKISTKNLGDLLTTLKYLVWWSWAAI